MSISAYLTCMVQCGAVWCSVVQCVAVLVIGNVTLYTSCLLQCVEA